MSPNQLGILVLLLAGGFLLLVWGWRGRKLNDHPVCRDCKFDLEGIVAEATTCPECGAGLRREGGVLRGVRKRMWPVVLLGLAMVVTPAVPMAAVLVATMTGRDLDRMKPLGLLLWEATNADVIRTAKIADEVLTRAQAKTLTADQYNRCIQYALELQQDAARAWAEGWGDVVMQANLDGVLTADDLKRFERQQPVFSVSGRRTAHAGGIVPLVVTLKEMRTDSRAARTVTLALGKVKVDGNDADQRVAGTQEREQRSFIDPNGWPMPLGLGAFTAMTRGGGGDLGTIFVGGKKGNNPFAGLFSTVTSFPVLVKLPAGLAEGEHELTFELESVGGAGASGGMTMILNGRRMKPAGGGAQVVGSVVTRVLVKPSTESLVRTVTPTPAEKEALRAALTPKSLELAIGMPKIGNIGSTRARMLFGQELVARAAFTLTNLAIPVAFDVVLKDGEREYSLGEITSGQTIDSLVPRDQNSFFTSSVTMVVNGQAVTSTSSGGPAEKGTTVAEGGVNREISERVTIVLRPSPALAARTIDLEEYCGEEIVIEGLMLGREAVRGLLQLPARRRDGRGG